jgi:hypothetical protein
MVFDREEEWKDFEVEAGQQANLFEGLVFVDLVLFQFRFSGAKQPVSETL